MGEFEQQVCVVTGGSRGIGRAIVEMFLREGACVISLDIANGGNIAPKDRYIFHRCDISKIEEVERVFSDIGLNDRHIDVLVNNAASVTRAAPITELSPAEWQQAMMVNITGAFNVTRSALPRIGRGGRIINLASTFAHVGSPGRVAYSTTKGAILAFTRSLALDVAGEGIRVNSISPGGIATDRLIELFGSRQAADDCLGPLHPLGHIAEPEDIANGVWYLASSRSSFMTGADLLIDGGYTAR